MENCQAIKTTYIHFRIPNKDACVCEAVHHETYHVNTEYKMHDPKQESVGSRTLKMATKDVIFCHKYFFGCFRRITRLPRDQSCEVQVTSIFNITGKIRWGSSPAPPTLAKWNIPHCCAEFPPEWVPQRNCLLIFPRILGCGIAWWNLYRVNLGTARTAPTSVSLRGECSHTIHSMICKSFMVTALDTTGEVIRNTAVCVCVRACQCVT
jgi:hypothetical protein